MVTDKQIYSTPKGDVCIFTLINSKGCSVELSSLGAGIVSVVVPDSIGNLADVALGYANPADYLYDGPCAGKIAGRYANRIANGRFSIDGIAYQLNINLPPNCLHGGPEGFQNQIWDSEEIENGIRFTYFSKDGEENFPGNLKVVAEYTWNDHNELNLQISAETDCPTVVSLTNHTYWNLSGEESGSVLNHKLTMKCSRYLKADKTLVPTGEMPMVDGTPMDFTSPKRLGEDIARDFPAINDAKGYDASWAVDDWKKGEFIEKVVVLEDELTGRILEIGTTQPAAHVYTGNWLSGSPKSKSGREYKDYDGVAIECQGMPDAPNKPEFPSQILRPGEKYEETIRFSFKVKQ